MGLEPYCTVKPRGKKYSPLDTDNKDKLGLVRDVEVALLAGDTTETDLLTLSIAVLPDVGLGTLEDGSALLLVGLGFIQSVTKLDDFFSSKLKVE